jgi:hypothetical protein
MSTVSWRSWARKHASCVPLVSHGRCCNLGGATVLELALLLWILVGIWLLFDYLIKQGPPDGMA